MARVVNTHEAKTHFSQLIDRVLAGEEIIVARAGKPLVKLVPVEPPEVRLGTLKHLVEYADPDWDKPLTDEELVEYFGEAFEAGDTE
jgi:prevent-host-death family protein